ncbi:ABC transporter [Acetonema longum DSM 6540]|uniref:ABC transporter n=1 Tax=Acetonema longum DSM 6540 TaxID=1009370 RepID=F7NGD2_9FIRM|nr:ABC transporter [Acetonema longum DSM 6540]
MDSVIIAEHLVKHYGPVQALKDVSFRVRAGECFGFLGHNGAGKSTTMRMIYGLSEVEGGRLEVFGREIRLTPPGVKAILGVVPQEDSLDTDLSVLENLEVHGILFGSSRSQARQRGKELLTFMGMAEKENSPVESLSGGLKRRLVIARALLHRPRMVILDEPTTGLDPEARRMVWQKLRELKAQGVTLLLTTHYMEEAEQLCDRLVIMHRGEILAAGTSAELIASYVLPEVIEVRAPLASIPPGLADRLSAAGAVSLTVGEGLLIYAHDAKKLYDHFHDWGLPQHVCYLRPASLEDVFLKLTGQGGES